MNAEALLAFLAASLTLGTAAQGTLQNLDFEQANPIFISYGVATTASAMPYWTVTIAGVQQTEIGVNEFTIGAPGVSLVGPGSTVFGPIDGNYSVVLQNYGTAAYASISQTGMIPDGSQSLLFEARPPIAPAPSGPLDIQIGNQTVSYMQVGSGPNYAIYAANISAWAGQAETLTISDPYLGGNWELDDITFSPNAVVPEPNPLFLTGLGSALLGLYRRYMIRKQ